MNKYLITLYPQGWFRVIDVKLAKERPEAFDPNYDLDNYEFCKAKSRIGGKDGELLWGNNSRWLLIEARCIKEAIDIFWEQVREEGYANTNQVRTIKIE